MKPKPLFLLDECLTFPNSLRKNREMVMSVDVIGEGATDQEVLEYCKKNKLVILTNDKKFSINIAIDQHDVILFNHRNNKSYTIKVEENLEFMKFNDPITYQLLTSENVIIP